MEDLRELTNITQEQADSLVKDLSRFFTIVRILKGDEVGGLCYLSNCKANGHCHDFWGKDEKCTNCISSRTLKDHFDRSKIEIKDGDLYQVFSKYLNIDGQDCVLEALMNITNLNIDPDDLRQVTEKFLNLDNKLYKDSLTDCFNRTYYDERKTKVIDNAGIVICDMDNLKDMNDIYGHTFGDDCLKAISKVLLNNVRTDDSVIRYGGDEFMMILPNISRASLSPKLERIRKAVNEIVLPEHPKVRLSVSVGAVICENQQLETAIKRADKLMYEAKSRKNSVVTEWDEGIVNTDDVAVDENNKQYLLIVDDSDINRFLLKSMLEHKYRILEASDGKKAIDVIEEYRQNISIILLDIEMPNMGGFEYLNYLRKNKFLNDIPVIMISSDNNEDVILRSYELGAVDFITRPYNAKIVEQRVDNTCKLFTRQRKFKSEIKKQMDRSDKQNNMISNIYSFAIEYRNRESGVHVYHVEKLTEIIIKELVRISDYNFTEEEMKEIVIAAGMHDIGKIGVRALVLNKGKDRNTEEEAEYEMHTLLGAQILDSMPMYKNESLVRFAKNICKYHHERYNGTSFPEGLSGDDIPIEAQVVGICNAYDSYLSKLDFKESAHEEVIKQISETNKANFNPILIRCVINTKDKLKEVYTKESYDMGGRI